MVRTLGAMLQLTTHSYIAALLFLVVGDVYEVLGSRCSKHHHYTTRVSTVLLVLLLANSVLLVLVYWVILLNTTSGPGIR